MKRKIGITVSILLILVSQIIFVGCGKKGDSTSDGDYYIKFTVAGKSFDFKGYPYANFSQADGMYLGGFGAFKDQGVGTSNVVSVLVSSLSEIKTGTYTGLINPPTGGDTPGVFFSWIDENGKTFGSLYQDYATNTVTITGISSSSVKGTFSGKIYDVLQTHASPIDFSGEFNVKRIE